MPLPPAPNPIPPMHSRPPPRMARAARHRLLQGRGPLLSPLPNGRMCSPTARRWPCRPPWWGAFLADLLAVPVRGEPRGACAYGAEGYPAERRLFSQLARVHEAISSSAEFARMRAAILGREPEATEAEAAAPEIELPLLARG